ncbi:MAG: hypothetical protein ACE5JO_01690 [Candidatus Binatia bacterium]
MGKKSRPRKNSSVREGEDVCTYCLFFQPHRPGSRPLRGNCTFHKEWIENASLTTCSDMSRIPLKEKGIYQLVENGGDGWLYVRRREKLRTRLFSVK